MRTRAWRLLPRTTRRVTSRSNPSGNFCSGPAVGRSGSGDPVAAEATKQQRRAAGPGPRRALGFTRWRGSGSLTAVIAGAFVPMHTMRPANRVAVLLVVLRDTLVAVE
jgi:hypothetical protein